MKYRELTKIQRAFLSGLLLGLGCEAAHGDEWQCAFLNFPDLPMDEVLAQIADWDHQDQLWITSDRHA